MTEAKEPKAQRSAPIRRGFWRGILRTLAVDLVIALGVLASLESVGRLGEGRVFAPLHAPEDHLREDGLRGEERPVGAERRGVVVLGDSTAFGTGVTWEEALPAALERRLKRRGTTLAVVNAGGKGSGVSGALEFMKSNFERFSPRVVVMALSPAMVAVAHRHAGDVQGSKTSSKAVTRFPELSRLPLLAHVWAYNHTRAYPLVNRYLRMGFFRLGLMRENLSGRDGAIYAYAFEDAGVDETRIHETEAAYLKIEQEIALLRAWLEARSASLLIVALPSRFMISDDVRDNQRGVQKSKIRMDPCERFAGMAARQRIGYGDLCGALSQARRAMRLTEASIWDPLYVVDDFTHLDARGNEIAAEVLAPMLEHELTRQLSVGLSTHTSTILSD